MYINSGLMAFSTDMIHWESKEIGKEPNFPGGECSFALADYDKSQPDSIILFTGGNHTGHFYAVGEVLFSKSDPEKPLAYLPRPILAANPKIPYEHGFPRKHPTISSQVFLTASFSMVSHVTMENGRFIMVEANTTPAWPMRL